MFSNGFIGVTNSKNWIESFSIYDATISSQNSSTKHLRGVTNKFIARRKLSSSCNVYEYFSKKPIDGLDHATEAEINACFQNPESDEQVHKTPEIKIFSNQPLKQNLRYFRSGLLRNNQN